MSGQVRRKADICASCADLADSGTPARYARRALLRAAVFDNPVFDGREQEFWAHRPAAAASVATGVIAEVRDDAIVLDGADGDRVPRRLRRAPSPGSGPRASPSALRRRGPGHHQAPDRWPPPRPAPRCAERIWARIGRVTGEIVAADGREFLVDAGPHDRAPRAGRDRRRRRSRQIQVRFPRLAPGYLLDVIGTRHGDGYLLAVTPATAQPPYRAGHPPAPPLVSGAAAGPDQRIGGLARAGRRAADLLGLGYPALDPETEGGPAGRRRHEAASGCRTCRSAAPSGSRNECADRSAVLPVTSDGAMARQFCDRCVQVRHLAQGTGGRPDHGRLRRTGRQPGRRLLQRDADAGGLSVAAPV